jgi:dTMP kinase
MTTRGIFVTFEGGDGSGKTTQCEIFANRLRETSGRGVISFREPGGTALGEKLRDLIKYSDVTKEAELLLLAASRAELRARVIEPALAGGMIVVGDRFADSTIAYQEYGRGLPSEIVKMVNAISSGNLTPDLTFFVDVGAEVRQRRILGRGGISDNFDKEDSGFFDRVREGYLKVCQEAPSRFIIIDGEGSPEEVSAKIHQRWVTSDVFKNNGLKKRSISGLRSSEFLVRKTNRQEGEGIR